MNSRAISSTLFSITLAAALQASIQSDIGYTELKAEFGSTLPDGSNLTVLQVEAPDSSGNWAVKQSGEQSTRTITFPFATTTPTAYSTHAIYVAKNLCGSTTSILPNLGELKVASVGTYRSASLNVAYYSAPATATWDVENHSLIGSVSGFNLNANQLLDFRIARDKVTVVVALENGTANAMQPLWGNNYNGITVGTATGSHTRGGTNLDGSGRLKPDLVGTATYTSYATPVVASAAGLLIAETKRTTELATAKDPRVIKALLMAGATKEEFSTWSNTAAQPLDAIYGAGQVNIYNSYKMLMAGQQPAGDYWLEQRGWDLGTSGTTAVYYFEVPEGQTMTFSTVLTWFRELKTSNYWTFTNTTPVDLNLCLYNSNSSFTLGTVVAQSTSALDNVEHIYYPALPAGKYALAVTGPSGTTYGIAWNGQLSGSASSTTTSASSTSSTTTATTTTVAAPTITTQPVAVVATVGTATSFSVSASGSSLTYQWYKDSSSISGATASSYTISSVAATSAGSYTVIVSNDGGSVTSSAATLTVSASTDSSTSSSLTPVAYTARGEYSTTYSKANLFDHNVSSKWIDYSASTWVQVELAEPTAITSYSFTSASNYTSRDPYNWTVLGSNDGSTWTTVDSRSSETFSSRSLQRDFALSQTSTAYRYYRFEMTCKSDIVTQLAELQLWGSSTSTTTATVIAAPSITSQPETLVVDACSSATFTVVATGESLSYQWYKDSSVISGATAATLTITSVSTTDAGSYVAVITNEGGSVTSSAATLTVNSTDAVVELIPSTYSAHGELSAAYGVNYLFDHNSSTKWIDYSASTWVVVQFATARSLEAYSLTSAANYTSRDPYNWTVEGSNDGTTWTVVDTQTAQTFATRGLQRDFVLSKATTAYLYFRFSMTCKTGSVTQLADLEFWGR